MNAPEEMPDIELSLMAALVAGERRGRLAPAAGPAINAAQPIATEVGATMQRPWTLSVTACYQKKPTSGACGFHAIFIKGPRNPSSRPRREPDDVARAAALRGGAHGNLVHSEAGFAKPFGEGRMRPRRPDREDAARRNARRIAFNPLDRRAHRSLSGSIPPGHCRHQAGSRRNAAG